MTEERKIGSVLSTTETKRLERKKFIPEEFEQPFLVNKRNFKIPKRNVRQQRVCEFLKEHMVKRKRHDYSKNSKAHGYDGMKEETGSIPARNPSIDRSWSLAPNRYKIKGNDFLDLATKQMGTKGPYACFTGERNEKSLMGFLKPRERIGPLVNDFYNIESGVDRLNHPRNYFVMKIRKGSREKQKPYLRFMLTDLSLCYRDPDDPSPAQYFPQNHCLESFISPPIKSKPVPVTRFYPYTTVPVTEKIFAVINISGPGVGRYNLNQVKCRCVKSDGRAECGCYEDRHIIGNGHPYVFNSRTVRIMRLAMLSQKKRTAKLTNFQIRKKFQNRLPHYFTDFNYVRKMLHKTGNLKFNTLDRPKKRSKLRRNKRIAFMSSRPRFPQTIAQAMSLARTLEIKPTKKEIMNSEDDAPAVTIPQKTFKTPRIQEIPKIKRKEDIVTLQPLPKPRKFESIIQFAEGIESVSRSYKIEDFLLPEWK